MSTEVFDTRKHIEQLCEAFRAQELEKVRSIALCIFAHWPSELPREQINDIEMIAEGFGHKLGPVEDDYGTDVWAARTISTAFVKDSAQRGADLQAVRSIARHDCPTALGSEMFD